MSDILELLSSPLRSSEAFLFWLFAGLACGSAIATVVTQNIVRSATWLLFTLGAVAGLFFLLGADLVGAVQILVYVGGTLVLVVFGVMLTAQGPFINMKTSAAEWALSLVVGLTLLAALTISVLPAGQPKLSATLEREAPRENLSKSPADAKYSDIIGLGFLGIGVGPAHTDPTEKGTDGKPLVVRTSYLLPFEIVSVHLLVVLIGAAYLARAKRRRGAES